MIEPDPPTEGVAIDALGELGLSTYEAAVFIALQQLETGTASEVANITDVPRSQVYGATERLEALGLIDVQQSNPIQYRAVGIETARAQLRARIEQQEQLAFEYLRSVRGTHATDRATQVDVWTVSGTETIDDRIIDLASRADDRILFGAPAKTLVSDAITETLTAAAAEIDVTVISEDDTLCEQFGDTDVVTPHITEELMIEGQRGRILVVDAETVLLSTVSGSDHEAAIWSGETNFAAVFIGLFDDWVEQCLS